MGRIVPFRRPGHDPAGGAHQRADQLPVGTVVAAGATILSRTSRPSTCVWRLGPAGSHRFWAHWRVDELLEQGATVTLPPQVQIITPTPGWLCELAKVAAPAAGIVWANPDDWPELPRQTTNLRFGTAHPPGSRAAAAIAQRLSQHRGRWAMVYLGDRDSSAELITKIRKGVVGWRYAGWFDYDRRLVDGQVGVFVRRRP